MIEFLIILFSYLAVFFVSSLFWLRYFDRGLRKKLGPILDLDVNTVLTLSKMHKKGKDEGFDLETAIKTFLVFKEWGHSTTLTEFLEFIKDQGIRIRKG